MRIFLLSLLIFPHLLCLSLPITGATLDDRDTDAGVQVNHQVAKAPGVADPYLTSAFRMTSAPQALLRDVAAHFKPTKFTDVASNMYHIVNATTTFRNNIQGTLDAHDITFGTLTRELEGVFMAIVNDLENIPPPDKAPGHAEGADMVERVLDNTALALTTLATRYGIEEEAISTYLLTIKPHVQALVATVGGIIEQHPDLLPTLVSSVATLFIPESWVLRPFLSMLGFGPAGPVKGLGAARSQHRFLGAAVQAGSSVSLPQKAGMGVYPEWTGFVTKVLLLLGGLLALLACFKRGLVGRIPLSIFVPFFRTRFY